jgi:TRAP-type mannitol/chloroaromatic compound transport system permease small subunit
VAAVRALVRGIDFFSAIIGKVFSVAVVFLVLVMSYEVVMRYLFNRPTLWVYDMSYFLTSMVVILGAAYTLQMKGHVSVDIFYERFPPRLKALIDTVLYLVLFFSLWLLIINVMVPHVQASWARGERAATGIWVPPIYPFKTWILAGVVLLTLQGVAEFLRAFFVLIGRPLEVPKAAEESTGARI